MNPRLCLLRLQTESSQNSYIYFQNTYGVDDKIDAEIIGLQSPRKLDQSQRIKPQNHESVNFCHLNFTFFTFSCLRETPSKFKIYQGIATIVFQTIIPTSGTLNRRTNISKSCFSFICFQSDPFLLFRVVTR